ncbi:hypothetical protein P154DRAFT_538695 [Amniculicola lignicola CBS 123094]|uniref:Aminoglycoside phosphotransferase domain-containing protein n=1 Tax=Amniculicola lignicola CBS 123094 TaxID=1392246 RepID=A0A6A5W1B8_9PLEO|nr:hypothetical protein P154DRAFT_538695 [Amniculicola lignicola CBS 123094]
MSILSSSSWKFPFIHIPKVYAVFKHQGADPLNHFAPGIEPPEYHYMIMEHIKGDTFAEAWPKMSPPEKEEMCHQMGATLRQLRSIPQSIESVTQRPYYGRFGYQYFLGSYNIVADERRPLSGPYDTYEELVQDMAKTAEMNSALKCSLPEFTAEEVELLNRFKPTFLAASPEDRRPVITHLDLRLDNIILRPRNRETALGVRDENTPIKTNSKWAQAQGQNQLNIETD